MLVPNWMGILNATEPEERPSVVIRGVLENAREQLTTVDERDSPICRRLTCGHRLRGYVQHVRIFVDEYPRKLSSRTSGIATQRSLFSKQLNVQRSRSTSGRWGSGKVTTPPIEFTKC
jgi:hypothetical protein